MKAKTKEYFIAANGYSGFRDYFANFFDPANYERLYVLKGGPGTGKSSLMKSVLREFQEKGYECETIFCSSDPKSLDGLIVKHKNKRVGILDGTSPHQTDPKLPGAIDEIINLGALWNDKKLISKRDQIAKINKKKSRHYAEAYEYLWLAGSFSEKIQKTVYKSYTGFEQKQINDVLFDIPYKNSGRNEETKLLSSFSKYGYEQKSLCDIYPKGIRINGIYGSEYIFMDNLLNEARRRDTDIIRFPSPFSDGLTEAVYFKASDTVVSINTDYKNAIDTALFLDMRTIKENEEKLSFYFDLREELLARAKNEFSLASDAHFELEAIYTEAMDFSKINILTESLVGNINKILS